MVLCIQIVLVLFTNTTSLLTLLSENLIDSSTTTGSSSTIINTTATNITCTRGYNVVNCIESNINKNVTCNSEKYSKEIYVVPDYLDVNIVRRMMVRGFSLAVLFTAYKTSSVW
jgi:hypothetical protein